MTKSLYIIVGTTRFELATPCTPCKCATGLRYVPNNTRALPLLKGDCKSRVFCHFSDPKTTFIFAA